jgi:hydroxymethylpyrimidine pyrophosphatase-like HAD family hydrolase
MTTAYNSSMRYLALATDGDGTLTEDGRISADLADAFKRYRAAGGRAILVTGETIEDLATFADIELFDRVVAENGAVLFNHQLGDERVLADESPTSVVNAWRTVAEREVKSGRVVVSTKEVERRVREILAQRNLRWQIHRNREDLLLLPRGIDKATGLAAALREFNLSPDQVAAIGDAENDCAMIDFCGLGVAVANAVPVLKECARMVTRGRAGRGVIELIDAILGGDVPKAS